MENKKKILISIGLIVVLIIGFIIYTLNNKQNDELDMNSFLVGENSDGNMEKQEENVESVNKIDEKVAEIAVHITGEIKKAGIVYLPEGSRLVDAIEKAGGETKDADLSQVNLAYQLQDGEKVYIPNKKEKVEKYITQGNGNNVVSEGAKTSNTSKGDNNRVNINTATQNELDSLPGIGPATAQKIIDYRETNGDFNKIEDLQNVKGIGESKFSEIKDKITV